MKKYQYIILLSLLSAFWSTANAQPALEKLWVTEGLQTPESVLVYTDKKNTYLFVSQIDGEPSTVDGKGGIAKMTVDGEILSADWVAGLNAPKGMATFAGKLYVADINEVVVIDIKKAKVEQKISIVGAVFLNDVTVDFQGVVYVSDTNTNRVYRIKDGVIDTYLEKVETANGLKALSGNLMVGAGTHMVLFDKNKTRLPFASGFAQGIDGIESVGSGDFVVSCWPGLLYYVSGAGKLSLLLDSQKEKINTADIGFDQATKTVYVPNFFSNTVSAYRLVLN